MKLKLLSITCLTVCALSASAQILNAGFENWTSGPGSCESVTDWGTLNGSTYLVGICTTSKESSNPHSGSFALSLTTEHVVIPFPPIDEIAPGICTNGTVNTQTEAVEGGDAFTERPTAFTGWYLATPVNNDIYSFSALLINEVSGDTVGSAEWESSATVSSWTQFSAPVTYTSSDYPTLLQIILLPSDPGDPQIGSEVIFDDFSYETITVGVSEAELAMIDAYPNPVSDNLFFNLGNLDGATVTVYNVLGVKVLEQNLSLSQNSISLQGLANGAYIWQLSTLEGRSLKTGKAILAK